ncbi:MAG: hypothetical protein KUG73_15980 [Pseudomonadales bacterium]|nr:hypothetical protein [Pseudomonadales bacterium]
MLEELMIELVKLRNWTKLKSIVKDIREMALSLNLNSLVQHSESLREGLKDEMIHETAKDVGHWLFVIIEDFSLVIESIEEKR